MPRCSLRYCTQTIIFLFDISFNLFRDAVFICSSSSSICSRGLGVHQSQFYVGKLCAVLQSFDKGCARDPRIDKRNQRILVLILVYLFESCYFVRLRIFKEQQEVFRVHCKVMVKISICSFDIPNTAIWKLVYNISLILYSG